MSEGLTERFKRFMHDLPGAEEIDSLPMPAPSHGRKKADYFLEGRKAVVELKSLEEDPGYKAANEVNRHRSRKDFPLFYGRWPISDILSHLPDGQQIRETIFSKISRSVKRSLRDGNEQIGSTKQIFGCAGAWGIVVLLNESIGILDPKIITRRLSQLLAQTDSDGTYSFRHVHAAWILAENFLVQADVADRAIPSITLYRADMASNGSLWRITDDLAKAWAAFNKVPLFHMPGAPLDKLKFTPRKEREQASSGMVRRHGAWRRAYRQDPYLRNFSDEALLRHGAKLLNALLPHVLKGGPRAPFSVMAEFMRGWTHFLEECDYRRLDLKPFLDLIHAP